MKILIGIDPSYDRTGISMYCDGKIVVSEVKGKETLDTDKFSKAFEGIFVESNKISSSVFSEIAKMRLTLKEMLGEKILDYDIEIISECPPPQGQYAPGLYALDTRMFDMYYKLTKVVYRVYPNYLMHIHGKRKYDKSESVKLAEKIMKNYEVYVLSKRFSHDEAESMIFLSRLLFREGLLPDSVVEEIPNIKNEKEARFEYV